MGGDDGWLVAARRARWLSYFSLGWMLAEGALGVLAGAEAHSIGVIAWAVGSAVEAAAAVIVIVRLTGRNRFSETAERRAQKWVAASFFLLAPYILYVAIAKLINGSEPDRSWLAVVLLGSSIVLMPVLGCAKPRLGERLGSRATAGEGTQNLLCAAQGAIALVGLLLASAGAGFLDPVAALLIAGLGRDRAVAFRRLRLHEPARLQRTRCGRLRRRKLRALLMADHHDHTGGGHGHNGHQGHSHGVSADADRGKLAIALGLILGFMAFEVTVGAIAGSLALLSDAAHMLTDAAAIGLSLLAVHLAAKPAMGTMTFGFKGAEILSAQFNGATLFVLALVIVYEAIHRLITPPAVASTAVLIVALVGIAVTLAATYTLSKANRQSMNIDGSFKHIVTDLAAFIATAIAGGTILATGFRRADPVASLIVAGIMLHAAYSLLRDSGRAFLEAAPEGVDPDAIGRAMAAEAGVREIHDLHVWEVPSGFPALSAHVLVGERHDCHAIGHALKRRLHDEFEIEHTTLQVDHEHTQLLTIETDEQRRRAIRSGADGTPRPG